MATREERAALEGRELALTGRARKGLSHGISIDRTIGYPLLLGDFGSSKYTSLMNVLSKTRKAGRVEIVSLFQVLGNKTRMHIVQDLASGEQCVCTIFKRLRLPQNLVSHHLGILREHEVILARREGKWVYYKLNEKYLAKAFAAARKLLSAKKSRVLC